MAFENVLNLLSLQGQRNRPDEARRKVRQPFGQTTLASQPLDPQPQVPPSNLKTSGAPLRQRTDIDFTVPNLESGEGLSPSVDEPPLGGFQKFLAALLIRNNPNLANVILSGGFEKFRQKQRQAQSLEERALEADIGLKEARAAGRGGASRVPQIRSIALVGEEARKLGVPENTPAIREFFISTDPATGIERAFPGKILAFGQEAQQIRDVAGGLVGVGSRTLGVSPIEDPRGGGGALLPRPRSADVEQATGGLRSALLTSDLREQFGRITAKVDAGQLGAAKLGGAQLASGVQAGKIGRTIAEMTDPDVAEFLATSKVMERAIARMFEKGRLSDQDAAAAGEIIPTLLSVTTEVGRASFDAKMRQIEAIVLQGMVAQAQRQPEAFTSDERVWLSRGQFPPSFSLEGELGPGAAGKTESPATNHSDRARQTLDEIEAGVEAGSQ